MDMDKVTKFYELRNKWLISNRWENEDLSIKDDLNDMILDDELIPLIVYPTLGTKLLQAMQGLTKEENESIIGMLQTCLCEGGLSYTRFGESSFVIEHSEKEKDYFCVTLDGLLYDGQIYKIWFDNQGSGGW